MVLGYREKRKFSFLPKLSFRYFHISLLILKLSPEAIYFFIDFNTHLLPQRIIGPSNFCVFMFTFLFIFSLIYVRLLQASNFKPLTRKKLFLFVYIFGGWIDDVLKSENINDSCFFNGNDGDKFDLFSIELFRIVKKNQEHGVIPTFPSRRTSIALVEPDYIE